MFTTYLIAGALTYALFGRKKRKVYASNSFPVSDIGLNYTCNSIYLINKTKFHEYLKDKFYINLNKIGGVLIDLDDVELTKIILLIFEQTNKTCYAKFTSRNLTSVEKMVAMLFFSEVVDVIEDEIKKNGLNQEKFDAQILAFIKYAEWWMNAEKEAEDFEAVYEKYKSTYKYP